MLTASAGRLHIREATGNNDGPEVEAMQKAAGARRYDPWCGCEQHAEQVLCNLPFPQWPAAARNWTPGTSPRTVFIRGGIRGTEAAIQPGFQVTFYYANLGRIGHVGRAIEPSRSIRAGRPARGWQVRAGNTGTGGGRDGAGVYDVFYPTYQIYAAANWLVKSYAKPSLPPNPLRQATADWRGGALGTYGRLARVRVPARPQLAQAGRRPGPRPRG